MAAETAQEETPAPVTVAKGGRGSSEADVENFTRSAHRKFSNCAIRISEIVQPQQLHPTVPYIGLEHIAEGGLYLTGSSFASEASSVKNTFKSGDILFGKLRPYFRKVVRPKFSGICSTDIWVIRAQTGIDQGYLFYLMASQDFIERSMGSSTGTRMPRADWSDLSNYLVDVPPLAEQKRIASILGALDDKIELNRRMNAKLEDMARTLFKSWFVDFDPVRAKLDGRLPAGMDANTAALFPDAFEESALGLIPKGWIVGQVSYLMTIGRNGIKPNDFPMEIFDHFSLPAFDDGRSPKEELGNAIMSNKFIVTTNSVLISKLNPHIPRIWLPALHTSRRSVCSTEYMVACPKQCSTREYLFSLFTDSTFASKYGTLVTGTTGSHQRIRPESVMEMRVIIPVEVLIQAFTSMAKPLFDRINKNSEESLALAIKRDRLLQFLITEQFEISTKAACHECK